METLLGIAMVYSWVHGSVVIAKKTGNLTQYEKGVLIFGAVAFVLYLLGTM